VLLPELTGTGVWGAAVLAVDTLVFAVSARTPGPSSTGSTDGGSSSWPTRSRAQPHCCWCSSGRRRRRGSRWSPSGRRAAKAFSQPAGAAALPNLVDPEDLPTASVLAGASWGTMLAVGAALGGLVAGTLGTTACFVIDAVLLLLAAVLTAATTRPFIRPAAPVRERRPVHQDVGEAVGLRPP
jgi:hypothetical protein